jgi:hypothetical protein
MYASNFQSDPLVSSVAVLSMSLYAHRLLQAVPEAQITIYASKFQSDVTTNGAAGVWMPYKLSETPEVLTDRCGGPGWLTGWLRGGVFRWQWCRVGEWLDTWLVMWAGAWMAAG